MLRRIECLVRECIEITIVLSHAANGIPSFPSSVTARRYRIRQRKGSLTLHCSFSDCKKSEQPVRWGCKSNEQTGTLHMLRMLMNLVTDTSKYRCDMGCALSRDLFTGLKTRSLAAACSQPRSQTRLRALFALVLNMSPPSIAVCIFYSRYKILYDPVCGSHTSPAVRFAC